MYHQLEVGKFLICGDVKVVDESYDHDFGTRREKGYEVTGLRVYAFDEYDESIVITECVPGKTLERYRRILIEGFLVDKVG